MLLPPPFAASEEGGRCSRPTVSFPGCDAAADLNRLLSNVGSEGVSMSRAVKDFKKFFAAQNQIKKLWKTHTPGSRIAPSKNQKNDETWQLRLDAGEVKNGKKRVYLQVNSQATNDGLKNWRKKHTSHGNLASGEINVDESEKSMEHAFDDFWDDIEKEARNNLK
jgi:hypothetical protein